MSRILFDSFDSAGIAHTASIASTVGITAVVTKVGTFVRGLADTLGITTVTTKVGVFLRSITTTEAVTTTVSRLVFKMALLVDAVGITDVVAKLGTFIRLLTSTESVTTTTGKVGTFIRFIANTVGTTTVVGGVKLVVIAITNTIGITTSINQIMAYVRSIQRTVGVTDSTTRQGVFIRLVQDTVGSLSDIVVDVIQLIFVQLYDALTVTDSLRGLKTIVLSILDFVGVTDLVRRLFKFPDGFGTPKMSQSSIVGVPILARSGYTQPMAPVMASLPSISEVVMAGDAWVSAGKVIVSLMDDVSVSSLLSKSAFKVVGLTNGVGASDIVVGVGG